MPSRIPNTVTKIHAREPLCVGIYGDSISDIDRFPSWHGGASCRERHYAQVFRALATREWDLPNLTIRYYGIGGQNTYEGLGRIFTLRDVPLDLTVVAFGANDLGHHPLTPEQSATALRAMLNGLRAQIGTEPIVMASSSGGPEFERWPMVAPFIAMQRRISEECAAPFVDTNAALLERLAQGDPWTTFFPVHTDCHPNDAGHALWGEQLFLAVKREVEAE
jgi:lysophospholipase L1-like esterase